MHFTVVEKEKTGRKTQARRAFFVSEIRQVGGSQEWHVFIGTEAQRERGKVETEEGEDEGGGGRGPRPPRSCFLWSGRVTGRSFLGGSSWREGEKKCLCYQSWVLWLGSCQLC